ncbi:MAG: ribosome maturation factor RimP [Actinomycetota bacterium]|jgi:ribosome maturation factor RimP
MFRVYEGEIRKRYHNEATTRRTTSPMSTDTVVERVRALAAPVVSDLGLEVYDIEMVSGVLRLSIDTPPGRPGGVTLDNIALVSRLVSRELDHNDPMPGRYTLEVTSPGLERPLRTPQHFQREVNKVVSVRLHHAVDGRRRLQGTLLRADEKSIVVCLEDTGTDMTVAYGDIERARTVFVWGKSSKPSRTNEEVAS